VSGFETELSVGGGYDAHTVYDIGVAPALSFAALPRASQPLHIWFSLPVALALSRHGAPQRDAVREDVNLGVGYRIGAAFGMFTILTRHFGITMDLEVAREELFHRVTYTALDGRSPPRDLNLLNLRYAVWWIDLTMGAGWIL
jgi:hypothetical protein